LKSFYEEYGNVTINSLGNTKSYEMSVLDALGPVSLGTCVFCAALIEKHSGSQFRTLSFFLRPFAPFRTLEDFETKRTLQDSWTILRIVTMSPGASATTARAET